MQTNNDIQPKGMDVSDILREAWQLTYGIKFKIIFINVIFPLFFITAFSIIVSPVVYTLPTSGMIIYSTIIFLIIWYTIIINIMLGVRQAMGEVATISATLQECNAKIFKVLMLSIAWLIIIGLLALCNAANLFFEKTFSSEISSILVLFVSIVGFIISVPFFIFTVPLVIVKNLQMIFAIKLSYKFLFKYFFQILFCYFVMIFFVIPISILPLGIGLIWTIPMVSTMGGVFFRNVFKQEQLFAKARN